MLYEPQSNVQESSRIPTRDWAGRQCNQRQNRHNHRSSYQKERGKHWMGGCGPWWNIPCTLPWLLCLYETDVWMWWISSKLIFEVNFKASENEKYVEIIRRENRSFVLNWLVKQLASPMWNEFEKLKCNLKTWKFTFDLLWPPCKRKSCCVCFGANNKICMIQGG